MSRRLDWELDGRAWPNRAASRFVRTRGLVWHVQVMGEGPVLLLAHGTGASTHSWRDLAPLLAQSFTVVAPDLPGHGFTSRPPASAMSLSGMSGHLAALVDTLGLRPSLVAGHSAGAAILCQMILDGRIAPEGVVSLNGALLAFRGVAGHIFSPMAKMLAVNPLVNHLVARLTSRRAVERLIADTGSTLDSAGIDLYARLVRSPDHIGSALAMMASWNLESLERDLPKLGAPMLLIVGSNDLAIPLSAAEKVRRIIPGAEVEIRRGRGHLAHEEEPGPTADLIAAFGRRLGLLPQDGEPS